MANKISDETIEYVGILAKLELSEEDNVFREDVVTNGDGSKDTLKNAPLQKEQCFKVPKTIG